MKSVVNHSAIWCICLGTRLVEVLEKSHFDNWPVFSRSVISDSGVVIMHTELLLKLETVAASWRGCNIVSTDVNVNSMAYNLYF